MKITNRIETNYPNLTSSERKVANYILNNKQQIISQTMQDVKEETKVGDATIIRFCQKIGLTGFSDLKIEIAKEDYKEQMTNSASDDYLTKSLHATIQTLKNTNELLIKENLHKAAKMINSANQILIYGVGASGHSAKDLERMLLRVGIYANSYQDRHIQSQTASIATEKDLVIVFSLTGRTIDVYDSVKIAKENKATIISITNYIDSPIADLSHIVLRTSVEEFLDGGSVEGRMSQMHVIDVLIKTYEQEFQELSIPKRERILRSVLDKRISEGES